MPDSLVKEPPGSTGGLETNVICSILHFLRDCLGYPDNSSREVYYRRPALPSLPVIVFNNSGRRFIS